MRTTQEENDDDEQTRRLHLASHTPASWLAGPILSYSHLMMCLDGVKVCVCTD